MFEMTPYAKNRLKNSVILYRGYPHYVENVQDDRVVLLIPLDAVMAPRSNPPRYAELDSTDLSYTPPQLGYGNFDGVAKYISRVPHRAWKHGLVWDENVRGISFEEFHSVDMVNCILGKFPTIQQAMRGSRSNSPVAFSRQLAVTGDGALYHLGVRVPGRITEAQDGRLSIDCKDSLWRLFLNGSILL